MNAPLRRPMNDPLRRPTSDPLTRPTSGSLKLSVTSKMMDTPEEVTVKAPAAVTANCKWC